MRSPGRLCSQGASTSHWYRVGAVTVEPTDTFCAGNEGLPDCSFPGLFSSVQAGLGLALGGDRLQVHAAVLTMGGSGGPGRCSFSVGRWGSSGCGLEPPWKETVLAEQSWIVPAAQGRSHPSALGFARCSLPTPLAVRGGDLRSLWSEPRIKGRRAVAGEVELAGGLKG